MSAHATAIRGPAASAARPTAGWVVLAIEDLRLALPQRDVHQIELAADLKLSAAGEAWEAGWLLHKDGKSWPAYCFDGALRLLRPAPATRRVCVFFECTGEIRGLMCDHVWSLAADGDLDVEPVPGCMAAPRLLMTGLARYQGGVAVVTHAAALARLTSPLEPAHAESE